MNRDEAKNILLLYRSGTADADDPQIAGALALARQDPELARWLEEHSTRQEALRAKFRQIAAPAGLREQIISEQAAFSRRNSRRQKIVLAAAAAAIAASLAVLAVFYLPQREPDANAFVNFKSEMAYLATGGYAMNLATNDPEQIRAYLAKSQAPADYVLPAALEKTATTGCAIEDWPGAKVAMICFRTGKPLPPNQHGDLWLFVVDRAAVKDAPGSSTPQFARVNQFITATWTQDDKLYLLGTVGNKQTIQKFL